MACLDCGRDASSMYSAARGTIHIELCLECAHTLGDKIVPVALQKMECRTCHSLGKCCRTTTGKG